MTEQESRRLTPDQLAALTTSFHQGSSNASSALAKWIKKPSVVEIDSLEQLPLEQATGLLAAGDEPICFCATGIVGVLTGQMILAFDDASGLALADMLLDDPPGTAHEWTEMAVSAAEETTNILCSAYLNSLAQQFGQANDLLPTPPTFSRDFAESLLEFALMGQIVSSDHVILARTRFEIDATPVNWTLLFIPDPESMSRLPQLLPSKEER